MKTAEQFQSLAEFLAAVVGAESAQQNDPRLSYSAAATGQNEGSGAAGGFLVPSAMVADIWTRVYGTGRILARCDRQPLTVGDRLALPAVMERSRVDGEQPSGSRFGGVQAYWTDEAGANNDSSLQFEMINLHLKKLLGMVYTTDELMQDAPALAAALKRLFGMEASFAIEDAIVNGNGVAKPLGILKSPALITVAKDGSQTAATVSATNLSNMASRLWGPSHASAIWMMGNDAFAKVLELESSDGISLEVGPNGERMLLQIPVELCEYPPALGSAGDIILADWSQYILAEREQNPSVLSSIHAKFATDESAFKIRYRVDGAPGWASPITPKNSANTQSPFVALGARA